MAKIVSVKAWGLWSHYESILEFSPGLTVITGPNGSGKSTVIRIIKWVAQGEPGGESFIFKVEDDEGNVLRQAEEGRAEIALDNGIVITKTRKKGKTTYSINTIAEPFEKAEVPQEIKDALGISKYTFGDFEAYLNYAFQLEAPFLLSESPSVGAKVLGKLAGTETVDLAIREVAKRTHKTREEKRLADKEIERVNGDLLDYQDLDDLKQQLTACEYLVTSLEAAAAKKDNLKDLAHKLATARDNLSGLDIELEALAIVPTLEADLREVETIQQRYSILQDLYGQLDRSLQTIVDITAQLSDYEGVSVAASILVDLEAKDISLTTITSLTTSYNNYTQNIKIAETFLATVESLDVAASNLEYAEKATTKLDKLKTLRGEQFTASNLLVAISLDLQGLTGLEEAATILATVTEKATKLESLKQINDDFHSRNSIAYQFKKDLETAIAGYEEAEKELLAAWEEAGEICPLCDQPVNKHSQAHRATH